MNVVAWCRDRLGRGNYERAGRAGRREGRVAGRALARQSDKHSSDPDFIITNHQITVRLTSCSSVARLPSQPRAAAAQPSPTARLSVVCSGFCTFLPSLPRLPTAIKSLPGSSTPLPGCRIFAKAGPPRVCNLSSRRRTLSNTTTSRTDLLQ